MKKLKSVKKDGCLVAVDSISFDCLNELKLNQKFKTVQKQYIW